jgi:hypothetical protein
MSTNQGILWMSTSQGILWMSTSQGILCTIPLYYYIISFDTGRTKYYLMTIFTVFLIEI